MNSWNWKRTGMLLLSINLCFLTGAVSFATAAPSDTLLNEGKTAFIDEFDYYKADAKFAQILNNPNDPNYQKACFWRALTVISGNPDLKSRLKEFNLLLDVPNDTEKLNILDKEGNGRRGGNGFEAVILDDEEEGYSETGAGWEILTPQKANPYGVTYRVNSSADSAAQAIWKPQITLAGDYDVFVWNSPALFKDAGGISYEIYHEAGSVVVTHPVSSKEGWLRLGQYRFDPDKEIKIIVFQSNAGGKLIADAVKLEFDGHYISENAPEAGFEGNWIDKTDNGSMGGSYKEINSGSDGKITWTPAIPKTGKYQITAYWVAGYSYNWYGSASNIFYVVTPSGSEPVTVTLHPRYYGYQELNLGVYLFQEGVNNKIELLQSKDGKVTTDGIRITPILDTPDSTAQSDLYSMTSEADMALAYLDKIDKDFADTANMHAVDNLGNPALTEIDFGDVLIFKSMLNLFKVQVNVVASYETDNLRPYELILGNGDLPHLNAILETLPKLGNLKNDAKQKLSEAKTALIMGINDYLSGNDFIIKESDPQENDLIRIYSSDTRSTISYYNNRLREVLDNLTGAAPAYILRSDEYDTSRKAPAVSGKYFRIPVDLRKFFDYPEDTRNLLPKFTDDGVAVPNTVIDPTFNGLFPDMKQEELNGILSLGSKTNNFAISWENDAPAITLNWSPDKYANFLRYAVYRSTGDEVNEKSLKVYDSADRTISTFTDKSIAPNIDTYYYRLYTYYADGTKTAGVIFRIRTRIYVDGSSASPDLEEGVKAAPFKKISSAVAAAYRGVKICVAKGTYYENDRTLWFFSSARQGIALEGGYDSKTWKRDIINNSTIITSPYSASPIAANIIGLYWGADNITIDGFTINAGQSNGVYVSPSSTSSIKIKNCTITGNKQNGVHISYYSNKVYIENCIINSNGGSGIYANGWGEYLYVTNCEVSNNNVDGIKIESQKKGTEVTNCIIRNNIGRGIYVSGSSSAHNLIIHNNLLTGNSLESILCESEDNLEITNNTIARSQAGIFWKKPLQKSDHPVIKDNIIVFNSVGINFGVSSPAVLIDYNNVWKNDSVDYKNCSKGAHDISVDPLFAGGPSGSYYLSQISSGQSSDSPCIDAGSAMASELLLDKFTTKTDGKGDAGKVDLGYHFASDIAKKGNPPTVGTIEPDDITVETNTSVNFTTTYYDIDGWQDIKHVHLPINRNKSWMDCFVGYYNPQTNKLYLLNDKATVWLGGVTPGTNVTLQNSYAKLNCKKTKVLKEGNELKVVWSVVFKKAFTGAKNTYLFVRDNEENFDGSTQKGKCFIVKKEK